MPKGVKETRLFTRNQVVQGPILTDDGVIVGAPKCSIIKFDRATVSRQLWESPAGSTWVVTSVGGVVLGARNGGANAHFETDGRLAWDADGTRFVSRAGDAAAVVVDDTILVREPATGTIQRTLKLPWRGSGGAFSCGTALVVTAESRDPMVTTIEEQRLCMVDLTGNTVWDRALGVECNRFLPPLEEGQSSRLLRPVYGQPAALVIKFGPGLYRLNDKTGDILWHAPVPMEIHDLTVVNGRAYIPRSHGLTIVDMATGKVLADHEPPELQGVSQPRPGVVRGDRIAFPCQSGHIVVHDLDGNVVKVRKANARFWSGVEADGRLILAGSGALVVCDESIWS